MNAPLVSVVIPIYNSERFLFETVSSVLSQDYSALEVILVDDGSTDKGIESVQEFLKDERVLLLRQKNSGVSAARNAGFKISKGEFACFLDSDDILGQGFIRNRVDFLLKNDSISFCCSEVITINADGEILPQRYAGVYNNILERILLYDSTSVTCPSNYLVRTDFLKNNNILFNEKLSSSSDRYFLIDLSFRGKGGYIGNEGLLSYRIHTNSMSHLLSPTLLNDNELYQSIILKDPRIPDQLKQKFRFKSNYILSGGFFHLKNYKKSFEFALKALFNSPGQFLKAIFLKN